MAGETIKSEAICLGVRPWSRTSHVVTWLTPHGKIVTSVKGAVRPKSFFLGQYDANYTCDIVYYARAKGEIRALRECSATDRRDALRDDCRALVLAEHFRRLAGEACPAGPDAAPFFAALAAALDDLARTRLDAAGLLARLVAFEAKVLEIAGLAPEFAAEDGCLALRGERTIPLSAATARCLRNPLGEKNLKILLDAARVIGVFYCFHLDCPPETRRAVLEIICR